jgi:orotidine-5'-phosphate decarboxylase
MTFLQKLASAEKNNNSLLCVGLDPDLAKLPKLFQDQTDALLNFNTAIVDVTADLVCGFKVNIAFYEALGADGINQLAKTCVYIREKYPELPILLDAKRADIGNTNNGYADLAFKYLQADAITLQPYLGGEALQPFFDHAEKGMIILCRTSNDGAAEFQDLKVEGRPLYEHVAEAVATKWNANNNCLLVVGATYPEEMKTIRKIVGPDIIFLVPGVGAQGGDVAALMQAGLGPNKNELVINSSRAVLYASSGEDFAEAARKEALRTRDEINKYRS